MKQSLFVTGTDTDVGKTVLSALLCAALDGIYWKPIQTGASEGTDRQTVKRWANLPDERTIPERYLFEPPVSPHLAARQSGTTIELSQIQLPPHPETTLIVEGAGGVLVPVNETELMIDLMQQLNLPVIAAARSALGTINHTLLTVGALRGRGLDVKAVVMLGDKNEENERAVEHYGNVRVAGRVPRLESINREALLAAYRSHFDRSLFE
jgi:dethiobiotin synthase